MRMVSRVLAIVALLGGCQQAEGVSSLRAKIEQSDLSSLSSHALVELPGIQAIALLIEAGQNGPVTTFSSSDRNTVSLQSGVLVRSAGFGHDLFHSDPDPTLQALRAGRETPYNRTYRFLTESDHFREMRVECKMHSAGAESTKVIGSALSLRRFVETCRGKDVSFENEYWLETSGAIRKSKEMVSPGLGYATIELSIR